MNFFVKHFGEAHIQQHATFGLLVDFSIFADILRKAALPTDVPSFKRTNLRNTVERYQNGLVEVDGKDWITSKSVLAYLFSHIDKEKSGVAFYNTLAEEIASIICTHVITKENELFHSNEQFSFHRTILDIYRSVADLSLREEQIEAFYSNGFEADEASLPTILYGDMLSFCSLFLYSVLF